VHVAEEFTSWLKETYPFIRLNIVPAGCTSKVQIADVVLNRPFKARMKVLFMDHASHEVMEQLRDGVPSKDIIHDLSLTRLKPLIVGWLLDTHQHLRDLHHVVREAYTRTGMLKAWVEDTQVMFKFFVIPIPYYHFHPSSPITHVSSPPPTHTLTHKHTKSHSYMHTLSHTDCSQQDSARALRPSIGLPKENEARGAYVLCI
jgi:hypothetical protein